MIFTELTDKNLEHCSALMDWTVFFTRQYMRLASFCDESFQRYLKDLLSQKDLDKLNKIYNLCVFDEHIFTDAHRAKRPIYYFKFLCDDTFYLGIEDHNGSYGLRLLDIQVRPVTQSLYIERFTFAKAFEKHHYLFANNKDLFNLFVYFPSETILFEY